ncbi:class I SAM-dependent methyltransferase [Lichenicola sp.]|uniref:class I SAM-dependent methyltransferase n=1 Tax=Lichenicola sp. TaxID=2804529 RepID=UPI003B002108
MNMIAPASGGLHSFGRSPLTGSTDTVLVHELDVAQIVLGYRLRLGVDVSRLFAGVSTLRLLHEPATGLSFFDPPILGDGAFYDELARHPGYYPGERQEFALAAAHVPPGARVCEIGAGACSFPAHIPHADYVGLEFSKAAIEQARTRGITLLPEDVVDFARVRGEAFDVTCAFQVLEHVREPLAFIEAMAALTRPGGRIILSTPNAEAYIARSRDVLNVAPHHHTWWTDRCWSWVADRLGFARLELLHSSIDEVLMPWARMVAADGLANMLGLELHPVVDERPIRHRIDVLAEQTARTIVAGLRHRNDVPLLGHSTVAVFTR